MNEHRVQFHVLSFEGPDPYSRAGGIATRVAGLSSALSEMGFETHLWFVGDPHLPGHEQHGQLKLHRWCQWLSKGCPAGVYAGEYEKQNDYAASMPPAALEVLEPHLKRGGHAVVMAEEWHTVHAVLHLDWLLQKAGLRSQVSIFWNANNTFGFSGIDWQRLARAATITTVSRYMKHLMATTLGVDPIVIPNGVDASTLNAPEPLSVVALRRRFAARHLLVKMARFDPDKRWLLAIDTLAELKRHGGRPLLLARGGLEAHGGEVLYRAQTQGLRTIHTDPEATGLAGLLNSLRGTDHADIVVIRSHVDPVARRALFRAADAVLANSGHEPFGLVGLETMAASGVACTGCSGEDYAVHGKNALVLQTGDPHEFISLFDQLRKNPAKERALRSTARRTALEYAWPHVIEHSLFSRLRSSTRRQIEGLEPKSYSLPPLESGRLLLKRVGSRLMTAEQTLRSSISSIRSPHHVVGLATLSKTTLSKTTLSEAALPKLRQARPAESSLHSLLLADPLRRGRVVGT